ncbi:hypothetical protein F5X68DRAFT_48392 [Plectosphaerella plurivora]|uniref:Uncharacterized protein n=1 Tax=Plectosphaerella plurivora TaxID=936078 RepID=A0A9P8VJJ5_9PEZI|nr:hypothetical protein F5X68DRAFT_48392 [Plectosphaerella plurivora]
MQSVCVASGAEGAARMRRPVALKTLGQAVVAGREEEGEQPRRTISLSPPPLGPFDPSVGHGTGAARGSSGSCWRPVPGRVPRDRQRRENGRKRKTSHLSTADMPGARPYDRTVSASNILSKETKEARKKPQQNLPARPACPSHRADKSPRLARLLPQPHLTMARPPALTSSVVPLLLLPAGTRIRDDRRLDSGRRLTRQTAQRGRKLRKNQTNQSGGEEGRSAE